MELSKQELFSITGGITTWAIIGIIGLAIFLIGTIDGFTRPLKCNK